MKLRFPQKDISALALRYDEEMRQRDRELTKVITNEVFPAYKKRGSLTKQEFLYICAWKTPRSKPRCESNDEALIRDISSLVLRSDSEHLRIQAWTLLNGVKWPTASVFLHFAFENKYPILDFRALWSLREEVPTQYNFPHWWQYVTACRKIAKRASVSMRDLDKALWKYSAIHQRTFVR